MSRDDELTGTTAIETGPAGGFLLFEADQPGTGVSDPVTAGALPTLEQWADSITTVLDDLRSSEAVLVAFDGAFATAALFAATYPSRTTAVVGLDRYADPMTERPDRLGLRRPPEARYPLAQGHDQLVSR